MEEHLAYEAKADPSYRPPTKLALAWKEIKWRTYLVCLRLFYRHWSRLIHRFGMHKMVRLHPMGGDPFYRCNWCGMHGAKVEPTTTAILGRDGI